MPRSKNRRRAGCKLSTARKKPRLKLLLNKEITGGGDVIDFRQSAAQALNRRLDEAFEAANREDAEELIEILSGA